MSAENGHATSLTYWFRKCSSAFLDQGLVSGSNFVLGVFLARWMGPTEYGAYVLVFAWFLLIAQLYQPLVTDPMGALQPVHHAETRREYLGAVIRLHLLAAVPILIILLLAAGVGRIVTPGAAPALLAVAGAAPLVLFFWLGRAGAYVARRPATAATASVVYVAVMFAGLYLLHARDLVSPPLAFALMAAAGTTAGAYLMWRLRPTLFGPRTPSVLTIWRQHWTYGRWLIGVVALVWIQNWALIFISGAVLGTGEAGALNALANLALPVLHIQMATVRLVLPYVSTENPAGMEPYLTRARTALLSLSIAYSVVFVLFHQQVFTLLYGEAFQRYSYLAPWYLLTLVLSTATAPFELGLRAMRATDLQLKSFIWSAALTLVAGLFLVITLGIEGVIAAHILRDSVLLIVMRRYFRRRLQYALSATPHGHAVTVQA
ncbi:MAG: lipopolysaccharide biosynthesis protein [Bryobacteraceae bacterium]|nr:lipopolysaccharide biosynthesis protein [Bryobacteraceae bacterium]